MKRFKGLLRDTWWAWIIIVLFCVVGGFISRIFFAALPFAAFSFVYFALMRYDDNGNLKEL